MTQLRISSDGRLFDAHSQEDLTAKAHQYLFCDLDWTDDVLTPRSIFLLMRNAPQLHDVFERWLPQDMMTEALGPEPSYSLEGGIDPRDIEYLEVFRTFYFDSREDVLTGLDSLMLHGVGFVHADDVIEHGMVMYKAGSRTYYGLDLTSCRKLLDLPVRFCKEASVCEEDMLDQRFGTLVARYQAPELRMGEFLQAMLEELAYYGVPESSADASSGD